MKVTDKDLDQALLDTDPELQAPLKQRMAGGGPVVSLEEAEAMVEKKARRSAPPTRRAKRAAPKRR